MTTRIETWPAVASKLLDILAALLIAPFAIAATVLILVVTIVFAVLAAPVVGIVFLVTIFLEAMSE